MTSQGLVLPTVTRVSCAFCRQQWKCSHYFNHHRATNFTSEKRLRSHGRQSSPGRFWLWVREFKSLSACECVSPPDVMAQVVIFMTWFREGGSVRIPIGAPTLMTEYLHGFLSLSRKIPKEFDKLGHDRFLSHHFRFINHWSFHHSTLLFVDLLPASLNGS
jgi:hypothetical protein